MIKKSPKKSSAACHLIVVAHPDDELIFFAGLILRETKKNWRVICVTDGNADGRGLERKVEFQNSLKRLKVKSYRMLDLPDYYEQRIQHDMVREALKEETNVQCVYTHNPLGEYGHPHHRDVSLITHQHFYKKCDVWCTAYNFYPNKVIQLSPGEYKVKAEIFSQVYKKETSRFMNMIPLTATEGFCKLALKDVETIFNFIESPDASHVSSLPKCIKHLGPALPGPYKKNLLRPF